MINLFIHGTRFNKFKENSCRMNIPFYTVFNSLASPTSEKEILNHLGLLYHHHWCMGALVYTHNTLLELFHSYCALLMLFDSIFHIKLKDILIQQNQMRSIQSEGKKKSIKIWLFLELLPFLLRELMFLLTATFCCCCFILFFKISNQDLRKRREALTPVVQQQTAAKGNYLSTKMLDCGKTLDCSEIISRVTKYICVYIYRERPEIFLE